MEAIFCFTWLFLIGCQKYRPMLMNNNSQSVFMCYKIVLKWMNKFEWFELLEFMEEIAMVGQKLRTCGYTADRNFYLSSDDTSR